MRLLSAIVKSTGEVIEGYLSSNDTFYVPVDHTYFDAYTLESVTITGCVDKPSSKFIVARLCKSWGGRLDLLSRRDTPLDPLCNYIYVDDGGEEVPFSAIVDWQEVTI